MKYGAHREPILSILNTAQLPLQIEHHENTSSKEGALVDP